MPAPLLEVKALQVLNGPPNDLLLEAGALVGLEGPSGAGKSLFFKALADLIPHQGLVMLEGQSQAGFAAPLWRKRVGYLPAESAWWSDQVESHFQFPAFVPFEALGLSRDLLNGPVSRLSTGEKQRLALLRLLENKPQVLLLDEPTASLDRASRGLLEAFLLDYLAKSGGAAIFTSHDPEQLVRLASKRYQMENLALSEVP